MHSVGFVNELADVQQRGAHMVMNSDVSVFMTTCIALPIFDHVYDTMCVFKIPTDVHKQTDLVRIGIN